MILKIAIVTKKTQPGILVYTRSQIFQGQKHVQRFLQKQGWFGSISWIGQVRSASKRSTITQKLNVTITLLSIEKVFWTDYKTVWRYM